MNDFYLEDDVLYLSTINRIQSDLYCKNKGYDHSLFKKQLASALDSLMYKSYYWRRLYGAKPELI